MKPSDYGEESVTPGAPTDIFAILDEIAKITGIE
jgi:hypothetical protein